MIKRFLLMAIVVVLVFGGVIGFKLFKRQAIRDYITAAGAPVIHLHATVAQTESWPQQLAAIGSLRAQQGIEIRSEVDGVIRRVHAEPGQQVKAGDLLVEIDDTVDRATLKSAKVRQDQASRDFQRDKALFERGLLSEDKFESSRSVLESAQALVEEIQGIIDRKTIRASFAGTVGIHNLVEGHYLGKGDDVMALQALGSLYLDMNLPEKELARLRPGQRVLFSVPSHGDTTFEAELRFIDVQIQATTRNVLARAVVDNTGGDLLPGMFASASIILDEAEQLATVPRQAVAFSLMGETVYLLEPAEAGSGSWQVHRRSVKTGEVRGERIEVEGLPAGAVIALDTQHRLLEGSVVAIDNPEVLGVKESAAGAE